jgi:asparagine synthase (glutamine-hydrolysing)
VEGLEELLRIADRNSMAHSTEIRLPFLNHELVEFVFSLPPGFKIHQGWTKWILRQAVDPLLPAEITWRKDKLGFEPPQEKWMQDARVQESIRAAKKILVDARVLASTVLDKKNQPHSAYAAENYEWKYWTAASLFR